MACIRDATAHAGAIPRPSACRPSGRSWLWALAAKLARPEHGGWRVAPATIYRFLRRRRGPHVAARHPGELICLDTFYIGKLKGVGKIWQDTACAAARFLRTRVGPAYRAAGWSVRRVPTDQGNEYCGAFDRACHVLRVQHTRTRPRHAWTNSFVERLQGTILTELWRIESRRRFFTSVPMFHTALDR